MTPVVSIARTFGEKKSVLPLVCMMKASRNEPAAFTINVPYGNAVPRSEGAHNAVRYRAAVPIAPPNTLGLRSVMFAVESVDDTVARLRADGAELIGEVAQYEDKYRLCYMRGPAGIIVALAEELT